MAIPTVLDLLRSPYIKNFFLLFPFLFLGGLILFLLGKAETLRVGAGLQRRRPPPVAVDPPEQVEVAADENADEDVDINEFLAEAGGEVEFDDVGAGEDDADEGDEPQAGPANGANAPRRPKNKGIVGKKKARNLEIRDRRRAYNEFIQSQAVERREREKAMEDELKEKIFEEKQRRALAEIKIEKQRLKEKAEKKEAEEKQAKYVQTLRSFLDDLSGCGKISLRALGHRIGRDEAWVKKTLQEGGMVSQSDNNNMVSLITESGWLVRVGKDDIAAVAQQLERSGKMSWETLSDTLESSLKRL